MRAKLPSVRTNLVPPRSKFDSYQTRIGNPVLTGKPAPGLPNQAAFRLLLSNGSSTQITVDDTAFPTSPSGTIFVVDTLGVQGD